MWLHEREVEELGDKVTGLPAAPRGWERPGAALPGASRRNSLRHLDFIPVRPIWTSDLQDCKRMQVR